MPDEPDQIIAIAGKDLSFYSYQHQPVGCGHPFDRENVQMARRRIRIGLLNGRQVHGPAKACGVIFSCQHEVYVLLCHLQHTIELETAAAEIIIQNFSGIKASIA